MKLLGKSSKGPVNQPVFINSAKEFYKNFGRFETLLEIRRKKIEKIISKM